MKLSNIAGKYLENAALSLLHIFFSRSFFRSALYQYLTLNCSQITPKLFFDPFECIGASILVNREFYEWPYIAAFKNHLKNLPKLTTLYVDIGANLGNHIVALSDIYDRAIAFEPIPFNYNLCKANIYYNSLEDIVEIHQVALGDYKGRLKLELPMCSPYLSQGQRNNGMFTNSSFVKEVNQSIHAKNRVFDVTLERGEKFLTDNFASFERIIIKVDCEGSEVSILRGLVSLLVGHPKTEYILLLEILTQSQRDELIIFLSKSIEASQRQYRIFLMDQGVFGELKKSQKKIKSPQSMLMIKLASV